MTLIMYHLFFLRLSFSLSPYVLHDRIITTIKEKAKQHQSNCLRKICRKRDDIRWWRLYCIIHRSVGEASNKRLLQLIDANEEKRHKHATCFFINAKEMNRHPCWSVLFNRIECTCSFSSLLFSFGLRSSARIFSLFNRFKRTVMHVEREFLVFFDYFLCNFSLLSLYIHACKRKMSIPMTYIQFFIGL